MPSIRVVRLGALLVGLAAAGCHASVGELAGSASDEWVRSYELAPEGEIAVTSTNGTIELEGYDGRTVEVRAQRTVKAVSDDAARDLVSRVGIEEEVSPERVAIRTEGITGLLVGVSYQVTYHVKAPQSVVARLRADQRRRHGEGVCRSTDRQQHQRRRGRREPRRPCRRARRRTATSVSR